MKFKGWKKKRKSCAKKIKKKIKRFKALFLSDGYNVSSLEEKRNTGQGNGQKRRYFSLVRPATKSISSDGMIFCRQTTVETKEKWYLRNVFNS